ncbi:hypothetical protein DFH27DRAFT_359000 [Peziza echinospora]|nr:hypothetical protein DFH27DRAFT_359000 [Peziza echinospora]
MTTTNFLFELPPSQLGVCSYISYRRGGKDKACTAYTNVNVGKVFFPLFLGNVVIHYFLPWRSTLIRQLGVSKCSGVICFFQLFFIYFPLFFLFWKTKDFGFVFCSFWLFPAQLPFVFRELIWEVQPCFAFSDLLFLFFFFLFSFPFLADLDPRDPNRPTLSMARKFPH